MSAVQQWGRHEARLPGGRGVRLAVLLPRGRGQGTGERTCDHDKLFSSPWRQLSSSPWRQLYSSPWRQLYSSPWRQLSSSPWRQLSSCPWRQLYSSPWRQLSSSPWRQLSSSPWRQLSSCRAVTWHVCWCSIPVHIVCGTTHTISVFIKTCFRAYTCI